TLPPHTFLFADEPQTTVVNIPYLITANITSRGHVPEAELPVSVPAFSMLVQATGHGSINFKLFGIVLLRTVQFDILPPVKVIPGGQSIVTTLHS
ncbi:MAG: stage sporulation protein, partial [Caproiciproducens sp.]|nr:stage sporulation protein [Caproiciproducens sp.]